MGSPSAERPVICRARPLNSAFCCRDACGDVFDRSGRGCRGGGFGNLGRPLPRFGFGRRRNTGAGVGGRTEAVSASFFTSSMSRRALNSSSRALCPSWLDARSAVDELTLPSRCHHDCCDSPVATARLRAVPDAFQRTPRFGRGPTASLHQHGDGPTSAIAPSGVNLGPRGNDFFHDFFRAVPSPYFGGGWQNWCISTLVEDPRTLALPHILSHGPRTGIAPCTSPPVLRRRAVDAFRTRPSVRGREVKSVEFVRRRIHPPISRRRGPAPFPHRDPARSPLR